MNIESPRHRLIVFGCLLRVFVIPEFDILLMSMGSCFFSSSSSITTALPTAKVIALDGMLREYTVPVTASFVLNSDSPYCFLCSSDMLSYDSYIQAMHPDEQLIEDQIYFVLSTDKLKRLLTGLEMVALAVKGSGALAVASKRRGRKGRISVKPVVELKGVEEDSFVYSSVNKTVGRGRGYTRLSTIEEI